jgi:hypothetical protein
VFSEWTKLNGTAPDGKPGFVPANAKSTSRGVNANPMITDYIFGNSPVGLGYYHVTTREAYQILKTRVSQQVHILENELACSQCCTLGFKPKCITDIEAQVDELQTVRDVVIARADADVPVGDVGVVPVGLHSDARRRNQYYSDTGMWYFPQPMYTAGGGKFRSFSPFVLTIVPGTANVASDSTTIQVVEQREAAVAVAAVLAPAVEVVRDLAMYLCCTA